MFRPPRTLSSPQRLRRDRALLMVAIAALSFGPPTAAQDTASGAAAELLSTADGAAASAVIELRAPRLPDGAAYLVDIDGLDVSAFVETTVGDDSLLLRYQPPEPLAAGARELRLFAAIGDSADPIGSWVLTVTAGRNRIRLSQDTALNGSTRLATSKGDASGARSRADGSLSPGFEVTRGNTTVTGAADFIVDSEADGEAIQPGQFLIAATRDRLGLKAGQHSLAAPDRNYLIDSSSRRGVSAHAGIAPWNAAVDGFIAHSEPLQGFRGGFGVNDPARQLLGGFLSLTPLDTEAYGLRLSLGALRATVAPEPFDAEQTPPDRSENTGYSIAVDGRAGPLAIDGELARSETDSGDPAGTRDGLAWRAGFGYAPQPFSWVGRALSISSRVDHHRIATDYDSRANFGLPVDEQRSTLNLEFGLDRFNARGELSRAHDNVDGLPIGRVGAVLGSLYLTLNPGDREILPWYGAPTWTASASTQRNEQRRPSPDPEAVAINDRVNDYQAAVRFDYPLWNWGLGHRRLDVIDKSIDGLEPSTDDTTLEFGSSGWTLPADIGLTPTLSLIRSHERVGGDTTWLVQTGVGLRMQPHARLELLFDANYSRSVSDFGQVDESQWLIAPALNWTPPVGERFQLQTTLSGNYQRSRSFGDIRESWVALLTFTFSFPWEYRNVPESE